MELNTYLITYKTKRWEHKMMCLVLSVQLDVFCRRLDSCLYLGYLKLNGACCLQIDYQTSGEMHHPLGLLFAVVI